MSVPLIPSWECIKCGASLRDKKIDWDSPRINIHVWCDTDGHGEAWAAASLCKNCEKELFKWIDFDVKLATHLLSR